MERIKKILPILGILALVFVSTSLIISSLMAAGTVIITDKRVTSDVTEITFTWTGDATLATVPDTTTDSYDGYMMMAVINPGSTTPTNDYDITINNSDGTDIFGGAMDNLSATTSEIRFPKPDGTNFKDCWVSGKMVFSLSANSVSSGNGVVKVYIDRRK